MLNHTKPPNQDKVSLLSKDTFYIGILSVVDSQEKLKICTITTTLKSRRGPEL